MKKTALSILALALLLTLLCASALAASDITTKSAKAYSDADMKHCIGTIPKFTCVTVDQYGTNASLEINGVRCYVKSSALDQGVHKKDYVATATLSKDELVYQRPTLSAKYTTNKKATKVYVYKAKKGMVLIRTKKGKYGFVSMSSLTDFNLTK